MMYHTNRIGINDNWRFGFEDETSECVTLPHTWNALDTMATDLQCHYRRGVGWYERPLPAPNFGHILGTRIQVRGAAGLVTDGALRDTLGIKKLELSSYCKAPHATTSFDVHHPLEMNVPIGCAGVLIMPGDVLVGDGEGVVAIPSQVAEEVAHDAHEQELREPFFTLKVAKGAAITGVYPPDEQTMAEYALWKATQKGEIGE